MLTDLSGPIMKLEIIEQGPQKNTGNSQTNLPPILFLHGAWHGAWCWQKYYMPFFSNHGFHTYAMSLRGHGNSPNDEPINAHSLKDYVDDLVEVVSSMEQSPIIIAHSMGGFILQKYLERHTSAGAVFLASVPPNGVAHISLKLLFSKRYMLPNLVRMNLFGVVDSIPKIKWAFFSDDAKEAALQYSHKLIGKESFKAFLDMLFPRIKVNFHTQIPLFVVGAENDRVISVKDNERTAEKYNAPLQIVPDIAHDVMLDKNHEVISTMILKWIHETNPHINTN